MRKLAPVLLAALLLFLGLGNGHARVWFIHSDGSGQAPTIQAGIDSSSAGDTVVAMPGVFTGEGNYEIDFRGKAIAVFGAQGFASTITEATILDCFDTDWHRAFYFHSDEDSASTLSSFIIRNFDASVGAITCDHSSPTILKNIIEGEWGHAIVCHYSSARVIDNTIGIFTGLRIPMYFEGGSPIIARNFSPGNSCDWVPCSFSIQCQNCVNLQLVENDFEGTTLTGCTGIVDGNAIKGSGLIIESSVVAITNNDISGNWWPAIDCRQSAVTIANNRLFAVGGHYSAFGIRMSGALRSNIIDNTIWAYSDFPGSVGIEYSGDTASVVRGNIIDDIGDGWGIKCYSSIHIEGNLMRSGYSCGYCDGGGIWCNAAPIIENNTISGHVCGDGIWCAPGSSAIIRNNIIAGNTRGDYGQPCGGRGIYTESPSVTVLCCDVYNNEGGNYVGTPDQTGLNGNISADPIFCDAAHGDYSIHAFSPCAPGNHPEGAECGLIGALGVGCDYVATLLQSYRAGIESSAIVVRWELAPGAASDRRFIVFRKIVGAGEYEERGAKTGIATSGTTYSFKDAGCEPGVAYRYRVDVVDEDGRRELFETDIVSMPALPLALHQNHPNPFNPSTTIEYYLPEKAHVRLEIYDVSGKRLATLVDGEQDPGAQSVEWRGTDNEGHAMASGVYFSRLTVGKRSFSRKIVLMR